MTWEQAGIKVPPGATGKVYTTCPKCSSSRKKNPKASCLTVWVEDENWNCNHCGWAGSLRRGVKAAANPSLWVPKSFHRPDPPSTNLTPEVIAWFAKRGIPEEVLRSEKIGAESVYMPQVESFTTCIRFPFFRNGEVINIKSRDDKKNFRQESNAERIPYGLDSITGQEVAVWVEGEVDKLSVLVAGIPFCVSVPDGAPDPKSKEYSSKFDFLENAEEQIAPIKTHILAVDSDAAGRRLEEELARRLGKEKCKLVVWPEDCKDANEVLVKHGAPAVWECINGATDYPVDGIITVDSLHPKINRLYEKGIVRGLGTGWPTLDKYYTVLPGQFTIVTGVPSHGKSEFIDALMTNLASRCGWSFGVFSPENNPMELHAAKIIEKHTGRAFYAGQPGERVTPTELAEAERWLQEHFYFVMPPENAMNVKELLILARVLVLRHGIRGLVLDPWNEIDHSHSDRLNETDYISQSLTLIRRFCSMHNIHAWIVAHPFKLLKDRRGKYPVPTLYDISGSAHWYNKCDCGIVIHRPDMNKDFINVHVQKIRFKTVGKVGMVQLDYDIVSGRFSEPERKERVYNPKPKQYKDADDDLPF